MRKSIAASIRISEIRDRLVELDGIETRSAEQDTELSTLMAERTKKELEYRTESKSEEDAELHPRDFDVLAGNAGTFGTVVPRPASADFLNGGRCRRS